MRAYSGTRNHAAFIAWLISRPDVQMAWDAYIRMQGVHGLYEAVRGESFVQIPIKRQPYGDWEFEVRDPNGYVLVVGGE